MLVTHTDATFIDAGSNVFTGLIWPATVDHVIDGPAVFGFCTYGGADEEVELQLTLQIVFLNMLSQGNRYDFRVTGRGKPGPAQIHTIFEKRYGLFRGHDLAQKRLALYAVLQCSVI